MTNRCLYEASFKDFLSQESLTVLGSLHNRYHGDTLTTTDEAWMGEIELMQQVLKPWATENGRIIFEYDIPRLGKRIDVVLMLRGMIFCLELKVGKKEDAATEIQVQGLELDFACVLWDADMRCVGGNWTYDKFNGKNRWNPENNEENRKYMLNTYRVLLTRARQGIVICVPCGNDRLTPEGFPEDPTRLPEFYDGTYEYLKSLGFEEI